MRRLADSIARRWHAYWFEPDLLLSASVARICVGIAVLLSLARFPAPDYAAFLDSQIAAHYQPKGILLLFPLGPPPALFFEVMRATAWIATVAWTAGLFTRVAQRTSLVSNLFLISLAYSWQAGWSHGYNPVYTAQLALALAPTHHYLSLDSLLAGARGTPASGRNNGWAVRLALLVVVMVFFNAAVFKLASSWKLEWAFSDNLRNTLAEQYLVNFRTELPSYLEAVLNRQWAYQGLAAANLALQLAMAGALIFVHRPWLRLLIGAGFAAEVIAIDLVMGLPNYHWLPLAALFVDWEYFGGKWGRSGAGRRRAFSVPPATSIGLGLFLLLYLALIFDPHGRLERRLRPYPLGSYPMFSSINCERPFDRHFDKGSKQNHMTVVLEPADPALAARIERHLNGTLATYHYNQNRPIDLAVVQHQLDRAHAYAAGLAGEARVRRIDWWRSVNVIPGYPAPVRLSELERALIARREADGTIRTVLARPAHPTGRDNVLTLQVAGYEAWRIADLSALHQLRERVEVSHWAWREGTIHVRLSDPGSHLFEITLEDPDSGGRDVYLTGEIQPLPRAL